MRVAIAEDKTFFRAALSSQLQVVGAQVIAAYEHAEELPARLLHDPPDVVLLDVRMPPTNTDEGVRAAWRIKEALPGTGVLLLSAYNETASAMALIDGGARGVGFLLKDHLTDATMLRDTLARIAGGDVVNDPEVVTRLVAAKQHARFLARFSPRQREVLQLMAEGYNNQGIADRMGVAGRTVEAYVSDILGKLGLVAENGDGTHRRVRAVLSWLRAHHD